MKIDTIEEMQTEAQGLLDRIFHKPAASYYNSVASIIHELLKQIHQRDRMLLGKCPGSIQWDCENSPVDLHGCPYAEEIANDSKTLCRCCQKCKADCAEQI